MKKQFVVDEKNYYKRIDKFLRNSLPELKLGAIFKSFRKGNVKVNGSRVKKNDFEIELGDVVEIFYNDQNDDLIRPEKPEMKARYLDFEIIYEDNDLLVINKPPKVSMHPGTGEQMVTIIEGLQYYAKDNFEPHLVHRLDKLTTGVLITAKNKFISRELTEIITSRKANKYYKTLVYGIPKKKKGVLESIVDEKKAKLEYKVEKTYHTEIGSFSLIDIHLFTGRKHQIRVQFSDIGCPVMGDDLYGNKEINKNFKNKYGLKRFFLHSYKLSFNYKKDYTFEAPLYNDLIKVLEKLGD